MLNDGCSPAFYTASKPPEHNTCSVKLVTVKCQLATLLAPRHWQSDLGNGAGVGPICIGRGLRVQDGRRATVGGWSADSQGEGYCGLGSSWGSGALRRPGVEVLCAGIIWSPDYVWLSPCMLCSLGVHGMGSGQGLVRGTCWSCCGVKA